jgi:membrane protein YdbS with pleckstrin-like domain
LLELAGKESKFLKYFLYLIEVIKMTFIDQINCVSGTSCSTIRLEKRKIIKKSLLNFFNYFALLLFFGLMFLAPILEFLGEEVTFSTFIKYALIGIAILFVVTFSLAIIYQIFYFRSYFYNFTKDGLVIKKGVFSRVEITVPYKKIQNVYVDQDLFDIIFKLYDVHVETAGLGSGIPAHIDGVNKENSEILKKQILAKCK